MRFEYSKKKNEMSFPKEKNIFESYMVMHKIVIL